MTNQIKSFKLKVATLPLVENNQISSFKCTHEEDICGYGYVPVKEMFAGELGESLFFPRSKVHQKIKIVSAEKIKRLSWSSYLFSETPRNMIQNCKNISKEKIAIHDILLTELYKFYTSQEIENAYIVCVIYKVQKKNKEPFYEMQLGVTGSVDKNADGVYESADVAMIREIKEETDGYVLWKWNIPILNKVYKRREWSGGIFGIGLWTHKLTNHWSTGCTCDEKIRRAGFDCCASGWGSCKTAKEAYLRYKN